jgi:prepilin-type N-terminal cleavage/methylation domain-containing protein
MILQSNTLMARRRSRGFTLIEIVTALVVLGLIVSGSLVVINNCLEATVDMRMRMAAFAVARENMEKLLGASAVTEAVEYGDSNDVVGVSWETRIEPFYEPHTVRMWIRAVSSASWYDMTGELKTIEFTQWLTDLTFADVSKIIKRQQDQQGALDEQTLAAAQELLDKVLQAQAVADTTGYDDTVELARQLIELYPNTPAADEARAILGGLPPVVRLQFNIQKRETTPANPSLDSSTKPSTENKPASDTSGTSNKGDTGSTKPETKGPKIWGDYTEEDLNLMFQNDPEKFWGVIMEMLNGKK